MRRIEEYNVCENHDQPRSAVELVRLHSTGHHAQAGKTIRHQIEVNGPTSPPSRSAPSPACLQGGSVQLGLPIETVLDDVWAQVADDELADST